MILSFLRIKIKMGVAMRTANVPIYSQQPFFCQKGMYLVGEKYVENIDV